MYIILELNNELTYVQKQIQYDIICRKNSN